MAAAMNGIALHGGFIPAGATFLVFTDYARPAMRLAALIGLPVIYVMTHDSIGLGEDGPTHQPVEHLAALRAIPNMRRVPSSRRDRDRRVLAACARAHRRSDRAGADPPEPGRSAQGCKSGCRTNRCAEGAYELVAADGAAEVTLFATGSEVEIAVGAQALLKQRGDCGARRLGAVARAVPGAGRGASAARSSAAPRSKSRSRPRCARAGTLSSARTAPSSACRHSGRARPTRNSTSTSELRRRRSSRRH